MKITARRSIYTEVENKDVRVLLTLTLRIKALGKPETIESTQSLKISTPNRAPEPRSSFLVPLITDEVVLIIPGDGTQPYGRHDVVIRHCRDGPPRGINDGLDHRYGCVLAACKPNYLHRLS